MSLARRVGNLPERGTPDRSGPASVAVVRERPWLVSDALVLSRLAGHPVLPVRDVALQRGARAVAFALGLLALPDAGTRSIAAVDLALDPEQLAERVALPAAAIAEAFRALWVADVLRHGSEAGLARFAEDVVPETSLAYALRWSVLAERLLDRRGEGSLAAIVLFRLLLDRLSHPQGAVTLPASLVADQLGLSEDQTRRGLKALQQRDLVVEQPSAGRAKQYLLGEAVLVGVSGAVGVSEVAAPAVAAAGGPALVSPLPAAPIPVAAAPANVTPAPTSTPALAEAAGPVVEYLGQRIVLPAQAELSLAVPGTRVAGMRLDPATGRLVVVLEPQS